MNDVGARETEALPRRARAWTIAGLVALGGCYQGARPGTGAAEDDGVGSEDGWDPADDAGGDADGDGPSRADAADDPMDCVAVEPGLRRLSGSQYDNTVATIVPGLGSPSDGFFDSLTLPDPLSGQTDAHTLSTPHVAQLRTVAEQVAVSLAAAPESVAACMPASAADPTCVDTFVETLLRRAFRREPQTEEVASYATYFEEQRQAYGPADALQLTTQRALMSPDFLFRTEVGDGGADTTLTAWERASQISYIIADGPPDAALAADAASDALLDEDVARGHVERLLSLRETSAGLMRFMQAHTRYGDVVDAVKDVSVFPTFDPALAHDMARATEAFIAYLLWGGDGRLGSLFTAPYVAVNDRIAALYGIDGDFDEAFRVVPAPESRRGGILSHASLLAQHATATETSIVLRGLHVSRQLLCLELADPPPGVSDELPGADDPEPRTQRDRLEQHREDPLCASCHSLMDPLGYPLEAYDAIGAYRETLEGGLSPDLTMTMPSALDPMLTEVANVEELGQAIAGLDANGACFVDHLMRYTLGPRPTPNTCGVTDLNRALRQSDGEMIPLLVDLLTSPHATRRVRKED